MVGRSQPMRTVFDRIARVAQTDATVLIRGESGTGKELVARARAPQQRARRPAVRGDQLRGAHRVAARERSSSATRRARSPARSALKKGTLELADGGTLFLDEIGELPLDAAGEAAARAAGAGVRAGRRHAAGARRLPADRGDQPRPRRGGRRPAPFRQDLFYRLNVVPLDAAAAARAQARTSPLLADYFLRKHAARCGRQSCTLTPDASTCLLGYDWPGNVRELENVIEQALVLGSGDCVVRRRSAAGLFPSGGPAPASSLDYHQTLERTKRDLIAHAFEQAGRNHTQAARLLGVHPNYLHRLLRNLDLRARIGARMMPLAERLLSPPSWSSPAVSRLSQVQQEKG